MDFNYTKEEYLESDKPFAALYGIKNPFDQKRALERMSNAAKDIGVPNFKALYKSYCDSLRTAFVPEENLTNAQGQPLDLNCGDWTMDEFGVRRGIGANEIVACQFPVLLTRRFENVDTGAEKVEISFRKGVTWRKLIVPCGLYASPKELVKLADAGLGINLRMASDLSDYFTDLYALNYDRLPLSKSGGRLGWVRDGLFSPFVDGLVYDGGPEYAAIFNATIPAGSYEAWKAAAINFRRESYAARIVLAASFASVLVKPLGVLPFFVHLWGVDSSTGKTVALMAAASVWASPEMGKYVKTFDGTDVGYERTAAFLNSLPMCIDELQLAKNARGQVVFNVYRLSQGAGRIRGNKAGGVDATPTWSNAIITTGETPINTLGAGAGAVNRVIELECTSACKVVQDGHAAAAAFRENHGHAGRDFVQHLLQPGNLDLAKKLYSQAFVELNSAETTDKLAMAAALIVAADHLATGWIFHDGNALEAADLGQFLASRAAVSLGARGYAYMCDWVGQNINRLQADSVQGDVYGLVDGDWVYIINSVFRRATDEAGFNPTALLSYLKSEKLVRLSRDKTTVPKRIRGSLVRCVCMKLNGSDDDEVPEDADDELL